MISASMGMFHMFSCQNKGVNDAKNEKRNKTISQLFLTKIIGVYMPFMNFLTQTCHKKDVFFKKWPLFQYKNVFFRRFKSEFRNFRNFKVEIVFLSVLDSD